MRTAVRGLVALAGTFALGAGLVACGGADATAPGDARAPTVVMTGPDSGYAVWPSGVRWIVLGTTDGWHTVQNRTPLAVPTDGGLVLAATPAQVAVGVLPHEQLVVSPVLRSDTLGQSWTPTQLPGPLSLGSGAMARSDHSTWALLADGSVVVEDDGSTQWRPVISAHQLDPTGRLTLTGLAFPDRATGFVIGATTGGAPVVYARDSAGSFRAVPLGLQGSSASTALAPCQVAGTWVLPVVSGGSLVVFTARDLGGPWAAGPRLDVGGQPLVACGPDRVWATAPHPSSDDLFVSGPGGAWTNQGQLGVHASSLAVVSSAQAFVGSADPPLLTTVRLGTQLSATGITLPGWVATVGGSSMRN